MRFTPLLFGIVFLLIAFIVVSCKARKASQKENAISSGKTELSLDSLPNLFTDEQNGEQLNIALGDTLNLLLQANITTGYSWSVVAIDTAMLLKVGENYFGSNSEAVGSGGRQWYAFKTLSPGISSLKLAYKRPWESAETSASVFEVTVEVE